MDMLRELHLIKYNLFKEQNVETGLFDTTFEVEGKLLYAHKPMLNLVSTTFASMFSDRWTSNPNEPIKIKDYSYDDFYQFFTFLYSGQCELTETNIFAMVDLAEYYGVQLFKKYCDQFLAVMSITTENVFKLMELGEKYSLIQLKSSLHAFITNYFQSIAGSDAFLNITKAIMEEFFSAAIDTVKPEDLFQAVYTWCEAQAMNKQSGDPHINLNDAIKAGIVPFFPHICFDKMELKFLLEFVVPRGFIFSSLDELSKILSGRYSSMPSHPKVKITNDLGQTLYGTVIPDKTVIETIKTLNSSTASQFDEYDGIWWTPKSKNIPTTPSPLKKRNGVEWYLVYFSDGDIGVTPSIIIGNSYLIAEMTSFGADFQATRNCKIEIE